MEEVTKMKRVIFTVFLVFALAVFINGTANAQRYVTGVCSNCHTMHNSENGVAVATNNSGSVTGTPNAHLTLSTCIGCHGVSGTTVGGAPNIFGATVTSMTAAGTYNINVANAVQNRHNPIDLNGYYSQSGDSRFTSTAPGGSGANITFTNASTQETCAGATGCHGNHTAGLNTSDAGIKGFHHNKTGTAYRYLQTSANVAITGNEASDWEQSLIAAGTTSGAGLHNVYSADINTGISQLCAQCHAAFHATGDAGQNDPNEISSGSWIRHPNDVNIQTVSPGLSGGTANIATDYINTPFGFASTDLATVTSTTAYTLASGAGGNVVCVTCHRVHGTANAFILRFSYNSISAGSGGTSGCLNCHYNQR